MSALDAWTLAIAVAAFPLAALDSAWTVYRDLLDRHKITVTVVESRPYPLAGPLPTSEADPIVIVSAINAGRRPVTITGFHFKKANSPEHALLLADPRDPMSRCFDDLPKELQQGQTARQFIPSKNLEGAEIECFYVVDTLNRQWRSAPFPLRRQRLARPA
jgi:hypothetical protein